MSKSLLTKYDGDSPRQKIQPGTIVSQAEQIVPFHFSLSVVFWVQMKAIQKRARPFG
jgi:hypothetical protein